MMNVRILIVDDDFETLRMIGLMLQHQGYEIIAANSGEQALALANAEQPDLIILDIMMPGMDGYVVARQLRASPQTEDIPIMMFTAKTQVDDKIAGYNAGADDYLTKPVHPAELIAHIKALLSRTTHRTETVTKGAEKGTLIGVIASKGGLGASSLTLNLAVSIAKKSRLEVIAAELRPGCGSWAVELGFNQPTGLKNVLLSQPFEINHVLLERELVRTTFGPQLLLASSGLQEVDSCHKAENVYKLMQVLPEMADVVLVDIGAPLLPNINKVIEACDEVIVVMEPFPSCMESTHVLLKDLEELGVGKSILLHLIVVNRVRADMQLTLTQIQDQLKTKVLQMIPPAPEVAFFSAQKHIPLVELQPEGFLTQQFEHLADIFLERLAK
ncbi:MAG TPA: response regulator [Anaerolineaceae bacterium]|nr:response regulator [Anaerolineaceae bacterium]